MTGFADAMGQEIAELERSLEADPRYKKLRYLKELEALYVVERGSPKPLAASAEKRVERVVSHQRATVPTGPRARVIEAAVDIVRLFGTAGVPMVTKDIYEVMNDEIRALIPGKEAKSNLSAMLFNSPLFDSHGRSGWTLAEAREAPPEHDPAEAALEKLVA